MTFWIISELVLHLPKIFLFASGVWIFPEAAALFGHIRNTKIFSKRSLSAIQGQIAYPTWLSLEISAIEFFYFAAFSLLLYAFTGNIIFFGGACGSLAGGLKDWNRATRVIKKLTPRQV
jgi:hypothetical protein